jgi:hypothetical protein
VRIVDLAYQLDLDVEIILTVARQLDPSLTEPHSPVTPDQDWTLRKALLSKTSGATAHPVVPLVQQRRRQGTSRHRALSPMAQAYIRAEDAVHRDDPWWRSELRTKREYVEEIARSWADYWFEPREAERWLVAHKMHIGPDVAASLRAVGVNAEQAALRLWYGKVNNGRHTLAARVTSGDLTTEQVVAELRAAGLIG